jgi:hypothetical protein
MKTFALILFFINIQPLFSQNYPFLTDIGSLTGSGAAILEYNSIKDSENKLTTQIRGFNSDYSKRLIYLNGIAYILTQKIKDDVDTTTKRYNALVSKNNSMSILNYSKNKENSKVLDIVKKMLINIKRDLNNHHTTNVLNGEKLNLYQNTMASLFEVQELMDTVEDQVSQSLLLDIITQRK